MKNFSLSILTFLLFGIHSACGQASWTYRVNFTLYDKEGILISPSDFNAGKTTLCTMPEGAHSDNVLKYDTAHHCFVFSQHTTVGSSLLVFVANTDTAVFVIPTQSGQIARLELMNGTFERRRVRADGGRVEYETTVRSDYPDFSFSRNSIYDRVSGAFREMTFSDLKKVELE